MAQSISRRLLTVEAQVQSQTIPREICSGCNITNTHLVFSQQQLLPVQRRSTQSNPSDMSNGQPTDLAALRSTFDVLRSRLRCNFVTSCHLRPCKRSKGVQSGQLWGCGKTVIWFCAKHWHTDRAEWWAARTGAEHGPLISCLRPSPLSERSGLLSHAHSTLSAPPAEFTQCLNL